MNPILSRSPDRLHLVLVLMLILAAVEAHDVWAAEAAMDRHLKDVA
ncbi:DNA-binding GntR family transcriptional regulator [Arthrobacter sp. GAS37]